MNTLEPRFCETCSDPLGPDEHVVQIREKVNASSQQASGVMPMARIAQEEIFGPVLSIIPVAGYQEAATALNQTNYGLSSAIFTRDANTAFRAMRDFETGIVYVNAGTTGAETHLPFGGWKETGNGHREAGHAALDSFTEWKSIYVDFSGRLQRAQIDNQEQL